MVPDHIEEFPDGAVFGTSSPRRKAQIMRLKPTAEIKLLRGNVQTRLFKIIEPAPEATEKYDATLLAVAGLQRAGLPEYAALPIAVDKVLPSAGQGALAIQCRADDHVTISRCLPLNDTATAAAVSAERQVVAGLYGDCHSPIAVYAEPSEKGFRIRARVLASDGSQCIEADMQGTEKKIGKLAEKMVTYLRDQGSDALLRGTPSAPEPTGV